MILSAAAAVLPTDATDNCLASASAASRPDVSASTERGRSSDNDNKLIIENEHLETTAVQEFTGAGSLTDDEDVADVDTTTAGGQLSAATEHGGYRCSTETVVASDGTVSGPFSS